MKPVYQDEFVTLYQANTLQHPELWNHADVLITDPPYGTENGVGYGRSGGHGRKGNAYIHGDADTEARDTVLGIMQHKPRLCFGSPRAPEPPGEWSDRLVWDKREPGLNGGPWRYTHESIFVSGEGWKRTSASAFSILSFPSGNGTWEKKQHVHAKPVRLMEELIKAAPPGLIVDPFAGSGSTLLAARNLGRQIIGVEIDQRHVETIIKRLAQNVFII